MPGGTAGEVDQETGEGGVVYGVTVTRPDGTIYDPEPDWQRRQRQRDPICQRARTRLDQLAADFNR